VKGPNKSQQHHATPASAPVRRSAPGRTGAPVSECASAPMEGAHSPTHPVQRSAPCAELICQRCKYPAERLVPPDGLCPRCAYPGGGAPNDYEETDDHHQRH
jgi:hypothetical protein